MSTKCNTCYIATTQPYWVALAVTKNRVDKPCEKHAEQPYIPIPRHHRDPWTNPASNIDSKHVIRDN